MCGIAGLVTLDPHHHITPAEAELTRQMLTRLRHRGPDSFVVQSWEHVCFAHARLSIVDLAETANQPLGYAHYWITFNGEIYNFIEVRQRLMSSGYSFQTHSDTEVIMAAYDAWGPDCLREFNGMWAFGLYDRHEQSVLLARDRFGVKPLYYTIWQDKLLFASEIKALLAAPITPTPNYETIRWFMHDAGCDRDDLSPLKDIQQLPAGCVLTVKDGQVDVRRWWDTLAERVPVAQHFQDRVDYFRELLEDATYIRLRNDVNVALTLSGGMDSSAIYAISKVLQSQDRVITATGGQSKPLESFSVSYPGLDIDEREYIDACLRHYNDHARYIYPAPIDFVSLLKEIIWHQESFVWNASVIAFHMIYRQIAAAGIRVVIEGHGSDEMLAGYPYLVRAAVRTFEQQQKPYHVWQAARTLRNTVNPHLGEEAPPAWRTLGSLFPWLRRSIYLYDRLMRRLSSPPSPKPIAAHMQPAADYLAAELTASPQRNFSIPVDDLNELNRELYRAFHQSILPHGLRVFDRATMAFSLESRAPFLDYRIVRYVFSLPESDLVGRGETKHILRETVRGLLPSSVVNRKAKLGFAVPLAHWFNQPEIYNHLGEVIHDSSFDANGMINAKDFRKDFQYALKSGFEWDDTIRIWAIVNLSLWWQTFVSQRFLPEDAAH